MSNLSKKMTMTEIMHLSNYLLGIRLEHGVSTAHETKKQDTEYYLKVHKHNLDEQELIWLDEVTEKAMDHILEQRRHSSLSEHILYAYNNEPPDTRTDAEIHADRLKEFTPEQIADWGRQTYDIYFMEEYQGRFTFDAIYNGDFPETVYEGDGEDPVQDMIRENREARIRLGRNWELVEELKSIVESALNNDPQVFANPDRAYEILNELDSEEEDDE